MTKFLAYLLIVYLAWVGIGLPILLAIQLWLDEKK